MIFISNITIKTRSLINNFIKDKIDNKTISNRNKEIINKFKSLTNSSLKDNIVSKLNI